MDPLAHPQQRDRGHHRRCGGPAPGDGLRNCERRPPGAGLGPKPDSGVVIYSIEGPLFFGAAEKLERTLAHIQRPATTLILRMGSVPFIDATGINALEEMVGDFKRHGASVLLVELRPNVRYKLERAGVIAQIGEEHIIDTLDNALQLTKQSRKAAAAQPPVDL